MLLTLLSIQAGPQLAKLGHDFHHRPRNFIFYTSSNTLTQHRTALLRACRSLSVGLPPIDRKTQSQELRLEVYGANHNRHPEPATFPWALTFRNLRLTSSNSTAPLAPWEQLHGLRRLGTPQS